jgi:hypothetical protein
MAFLILQLVIPVAVMNAMASGSVISHVVLLVLEDVEDDDVLLDVLLLDVEEDVLLDVEEDVLLELVLLLVDVLVLGVPPPGRLESFTFL